MQKTPETSGRLGSAGRLARGFLAVFAMLLALVPVQLLAAVELCPAVQTTEFSLLLHGNITLLAAVDGDCASDRLSRASWYDAGTMAVHHTHMTRT
jgi:hypothetical protein